MLNVKWLCEIIKLFMAGKKLISVSLLSIKVNYECVVCSV